MNAEVQLLPPPVAPQDMLAALRSDHAGESGAVEIYRGILAVSRSREVKEFARHHLATEQMHLRLIEQVLPAGMRSRLLPLWRMAGWLTGALPALVGPAAVFRTIDAVESFVDKHYAEQIEMLQGRHNDKRLLQLLEACREDELAHRDEARARLGEPGLIGRLWRTVVIQGSRIGVFFASRY